MAKDDTFELENLKNKHSSLWKCSQSALPIRFIITILCKINLAIFGILLVFTSPEANLEKSLKCKQKASIWDKGTGEIT